MRPGLLYAIIVFACGFALGAIRVLYVAPKIGALAAVVIEAPIMLALSWRICRVAVRRFQVGPAILARAVMGVVAFFTLMACEFGLGVFFFHKTLGAIFYDYATAPGAVGLAAQFVFALIPILQGIAAKRAAAWPGGVNVSGREADDERAQRFDG